MTTVELTVRLKTPHAEQERFIRSPAKRKILRAGRRSGKTTGVSILAGEKFLDEERVLYAAPTQDQTDKFWREITTAFYEPVEAGIFYLNQTRRFIERPRTENRIRAKTAWDADTMRGDYAGFLVFEEFQLMKPEAWYEVGAPMLLDVDGTAVFIYTPGYVSMAKKPIGRHASDLFKYAQKKYKEAIEKGEVPRWEAFHFTSFDNPYISADALDEISEDMTPMAFRREILAEDIDDNPHALWNRAMIDLHRVDNHPELTQIFVAIDPPGKSTGARCGIVLGGSAMIGNVSHVYILNDLSMRGRPDQWASRAVGTYHSYKANKILAEVNMGWDMVANTIKSVPGGENVPVEQIRATRGKLLRAEPVANLYAQGRVHHVGYFGDLEDQMCMWMPGMPSPDNLDALVYLVTKLLIIGRGWSASYV